MIDITGLDAVREGDPVTVFGKGLPVSKVAEWAGTIPYEILTGISQRVKEFITRNKTSPTVIFVVLQVDYG